MSRRRARGVDVDHRFVVIHIVCAEGHQVGGVYRSNGADMLEHPLLRVDGPNGETKVRATCSTCEAAGRRNDPQFRWERLRGMLDELEADPHCYRTSIRVD